MLKEKHIRQQKVLNKVRAQFRIVVDDIKRVLFSVDNSVSGTHGV